MHELWVSPWIFKSRKFGNYICFIMAVFRISVRKMSWENNHCNEENTVKMIQILNLISQIGDVQFLDERPLYCIFRFINNCSQAFELSFTICCQKEDSSVGLTAMSEKVQIIGFFLLVVQRYWFSFKESKILEFLS